MVTTTTRAKPADSDAADGETVINNLSDSSSIIGQLEPRGHQKHATRKWLTNSRTWPVLFIGAGMAGWFNRPLFAGTAPDSAPSRQAVLFQCDFELQNWFAAWGERRPDPHTETVEADPARKFVPLRGKALRVRVDQGGHYGVSLQYRFRQQTGAEPEAIFFRYYLRFADDWRPGRGGKLPGIGGTYGRAGWGGRPVHGDDGWSARGLFKGLKNGRTAIGYYCYHAGMKGRYGDNWVWNRNNLGYLENNRWYCIEQYVRLNTPGKHDGILRGWVDGRLAFEKTDVRMRDVDRLKIETIWVNVYYGGTWAAEADYHLYLDNVVISKQYIGPLNERK